VRVFEDDNTTSYYTLNLFLVTSIFWKNFLIMHLYKHQFSVAVRLLRYAL